MSLCVKYEGDALREEVKRLEKENAEIKETIEANLRVHKAAEKSDAERIWKLQKENAELRECLGEAVTSRCNFCSAQRMISCVKNEILCEVKKWRAVLKGVE